MKDRRHRDEGAVMVFVAIMMVVLIAIGALVIDIGRLYVEKRVLQNGADAAALAVAWDCAGGVCDTAQKTADDYADANAKAGDSDRGYSDAEVCGTDGLGTCDPAFDPDYPHWVRVMTMSADDNDGVPDQVNYLLAPVMDLLDDGKIVTATAVVAWGSLASGGDTPFVFSACEFNYKGGTFPPVDDSIPDFPSGVNTIYFHGPQGDVDEAEEHCLPGIPSGLDLPGGFGRVGDVNGPCAYTVSDDGMAVRNPGNDLSKGCDLSSWQYNGTDDSLIVIALYDTVSRHSGGNGNNNNSIKAYHIAGFVGFKLMGYRMGGNRYWSYNESVCPIGPANSSYFCGEFTKVSVSRGDLGTGPNYGASVVKLIG